MVFLSLLQAKFLSQDQINGRLSFFFFLPTHSEIWVSLGAVLRPHFVGG